MEVLRELALDLKQSKLSAVEAIVGISMLSRLSELGIEPADIESCAAAGHVLADDSVDLPAFARAALALEEARKQTGLSIEELEDRAEELEDRASELESLEEKVSSNEEELAALEAQKGSMTHHMAQLKEACQGLDGAIKGREEREAELSRRVLQLEERAHAADEKLASARADLAMLAGLGMSLEGLRGFVQRLHGVADRHGVGPDALRDWLLGELEQFGEGLSLESVVEGRREDLEVLEEAIGKAGEQLASLNRQNEELGRERASLKAAVEQEGKHIASELKAIKEAAGVAVADLKHQLGEGVNESLVEMAGLRGQALELGREMGRNEEMLEANRWLKTLLDLANGGAAIEAADVRSLGILLLRGLSGWAGTNAGVLMSSPLLKVTVDNAVGELERWNP